MTDYYVGRKRAVQPLNRAYESLTATGPYPSRDAAFDHLVGVHSSSLFKVDERTGIVNTPRQSDWLVLLDTSSVDIINPDELHLLLNTDPVLSAIFKLGQNYGRQACDKRIRD